MAHKKAGGSTRNGRDSQSKRLGVKKFGGQPVVSREHSSCASGARSFIPAPNVGCGRDHTLFATANGVVKFEQRGALQRKIVSVVAE